MKYRYHRSFSSSLSALYAKTLNLPKTDFPIKRHEIIDFNETTNDYPKKKREFTILDGPPFANGPLHIGHAVNRILKDIVVRHKRQSGFHVKLAPGWDCHGLPIELKAQQATMEQDSSVDAILIRSKCRAYAEDAINYQMKSLKQWGLELDYDNAYATMHPSYEAAQLRILAGLNDKKFIYRDSKPVYWSPSSQTVLANAEIEYDEKFVSQAVFVAFKVIDQDFSLLIWTTTPWTLPANAAVAINPNLKYCIASDASRRYIVAKDLLSSQYLKELIFEADISPEKIMQYQYTSPINNRVCPIISADFVNCTSGTGLVHMAPQHGIEDYHAYRQNFKHIVDDVHYVDLSARFTVNAGSDLSGHSIFETAYLNSILQQRNVLFATHEYTHSYPIDWRTKQPVITLTMQQWFIDTKTMIEQMEKDQVLEQIQFYPENGQDRLQRNLKSRQEWCISRQRVWGVPIPALKSKNGEIALDSEFIKSIADRVESNYKASDIWWSDQGQEVEKCYETMDIWIDSGCAWHRHQNVDLIIEGVDQYRGWFQSSLLLNWAYNNKTTFKKIASHGFVLDSNGQKMSKSLGNVIDPQSLIDKYSLETLRLWVASMDWTSDMVWSKEAMESMQQLKSKIRNSLRFALGNLYDYEDSKAPERVLYKIDNYAVSVASKLSRSVKDHLDSLETSKAISAISHFVNTDLSFYYSAIKDRLYVSGPDSLERRSAQRALIEITKNLCWAIKPVNPWTAQEAISHLKALGIHIDTPKDCKYKGKTDFEMLRRFRNYFLTEHYMMGKSLQQLSVAAIKNDSILLKNEEMVEILSVGEFKWIKKESPNHEWFDPVSGLIIGYTVSLLAGTKCPRCWVYAGHLDDLCRKCARLVCMNPIDNHV